MDCCSSNYMDYRHSINNNFCYPYSPGMIRSASPYPMGMGTSSAGSRYVGEYRGGYYDSFEKYYGYHHGQSHGSYGSHYYSNYSSYRDFAYNDYYHGSPSVSSASHPFPGLGGYHGASHLYNRQSLPLPFQREPYFSQRDHHQYANFSNYSGNPFKGDSSASTTNPLVNGSSSGNNNSSSSNNSNRSNGESPLFSAQNGYSHSADYSAQSYGSGSPNHSHHPHPHHSVEEPGGAMGNGFPSAISNATGFTPSIKDARARKLKERKLANKSPYCSSPSGGQNSACSSPNPGSSGSPGSSCTGNARLKSIDSLSNDRFDQEGAIHSPTSRHPSPGRAGGVGRNASGGSPPKRSKKQSTRQRIGDHAKLSESGSNCNSLTTPTIDKNVTPLPGFQQAFGSTEIGKFSEVFFNNSPGPNDLLADNDQLPPGHPQQQQHPHHHHHHHHQLMMDSLTACKSDVDTVSPHSWEQPTGPGDPFDGSAAGFNLQIGTSFHPSYYESSSYSSEHAVDSPLGNYFSEMTCSEYVN